MHEELIKELDDAATAYSNGFYSPNLPSAAFKSISALRQDAETIAKLRKAIEDAIRHQEIVGGSLSQMSTTVKILKDALA